mmetsp:Transcript_53735/g.126560  ORF Transcript_53735/g.126560 Transcript_53735/m.126560 type:complete len:307 (-) Transcript_53735:4949-5869(-)
MPGRDPRRRAVGPGAQGAGVVALRAVDAQRIRHVHHQAIGPLRLLDRLAVAGRERLGARHADRFGAKQEGCERVVRQRGQPDAGRGCVLPGTVTGKAVGALGLQRLEPDLLGHRLAAVAGVAGDAGLADVALPLAVDRLRHLQHPPCHHLGVERVVGEILYVVAMHAALLGGHPAGHGRHGAVELADAEVAQHLDVLVDLPGLRAIRRRRIQRCRGLVAGRLLGQRAGVVDQLHARAAVAALHGLDRWPLAASQQGANQGQARDGDEVSLHAWTPDSDAAALAGVALWCRDAAAEAATSGSRSDSR